MPATVGEEAAHDITGECRLHYPHENNVICSFDGGKLRLIAENNYDPEGLNLMDEFSDTISAYIAELFDGTIRLVGIEKRVD
ncbi:hypothetical protein [Edaphosphingomonas haloaromaticamans]|uniref:hypothetical protein n=1 Tax=Edaphosphingomonas haloaromaticamans TaxID=653954 RepID=UPI001113D4C5|nr:hypothetical protein [Sphingomonas haloaromaticamans]